MKAAPLAVLVVLTAVAVGCGSSHRQASRAEPPPPPNAAKQVAIRKIVLKEAASEGDATPTSAVLIPTTRRNAELVDVDTKEPDTPLYLVLVRGDFNRGNLLAVSIDARTDKSVGAGLVGAMPDAKSVGKPETLSLGEPASIRYQPEGLSLTAVPPSYRPAVSRAEVLALFRRWPPGPRLEGHPTVRLWMVAGSSAGRSSYPAWVLTFHHTAPISYGPVPVSSKRKCVSVAIYDIPAQTWSENFQNCPDGPAKMPSCDAGCTPANQAALDSAADEAQKIAGRRYYTGAAVDDAANKVTVWLANAPRSVLTALNGAHRGIYAIHNDAPRPRSVVAKLQNSIDWNALRSEGIRIFSTGPSEDGYLRVGVNRDIAKAQAKLDAIYGPNIIRVFKTQPAIAAALTAG